MKTCKQLTCMALIALFAIAGFIGCGGDPEPDPQTPTLIVTVTGLKNGYAIADEMLTMTAQLDPATHGAGFNPPESYIYSWSIGTETVGSSTTFTPTEAQVGKTLTANASLTGANAAVKGSVGHDIAASVPGGSIMVTIVDGRTNKTQPFSAILDKLKTLLSTSGVNSNSNYNTVKVRGLTIIVEDTSYADYRAINWNTVGANAAFVSDDSVPPPVNQTQFNAIITSMVPMTEAD